MVAPRFRSRTFRRIKVKLARRVVTHYRKRKPSHAQCATCGVILKGVPRDVPYKIAGLPKTKKRPERPYGGKLCSSCMRTFFIEKHIAGNVGESA